jgi:hypothetical protein
VARHQAAAAVEQVLSVAQVVVQPPVMVVLAHQTVLADHPFIMQVVVAVHQQQLAELAATAAVVVGVYLVLHQVLQTQAAAAVELI